MHPSGVANAQVAAFIPRERARAWARRVVGKRVGRFAMARTAAEFSRAFRTNLVDAALVDVVGAEADDEVAGLALEYPSVAFVGLTTLRPADAPGLARCVRLELADVLVEGVDDVAAPDLIARHGYSSRFAAALHTPPSVLALASALQLAAWRYIVAGGGRPIRTSTLAAALGLTREHLSRSFGSGGTPTLKRLIDLVRLLSAAELAKNPGYDVADVARVLKFSSSAHLSLTAQRLIGRRATSLAAMRGVDIIERFVQEQQASPPATVSELRPERPVGRR